MNFESLESRRMLSVSFNLDSSGLLSIIGTHNNDSVHLGSKKHFKTDLKKYTDIDFSKVKRILVNMMAGNDTIVLNDNIHVPVTMIGGSGSDSLRAGGGDDQIIADAGDTICGGDGFDTADFTTSMSGIRLDLSDKTTEAVMGSAFADTITGSDGNDIIFGEGGGDSIDGMGGDDYIDAGPGRDRLDGGKGDDVFLNFDGSTDQVDGGGGNDFAEADRADTFSNIDFVFDQEQIIDSGGGESGGGDTSGGDSGGTESGGTESGGLTAQSLSTIHAALALKVLAIPVATLNNGVLTINGTSSSNSISVILDSTGKKIDVSVDGGSDVFNLADVDSISIDAGGGNDSIALQRGDGSRAIPVPAKILGSNGNDTIVGGANNDTISGGSGNDSILGMGGRDSLSGALGDDTLDGGSSDDYLDGGDNGITGDDGADVIIGGSGLSDTVIYTSRTDDLTINIADSSHANDGANGEGDDVNSDVENILSGTGDDTLTGNSSANLISGNAGNDVITGNGGHDKLIGGAGSDSLSNAGSDVTMYSMLDQGRDDFDAALDSSGHVTGDLVSGDVGADFSSVSGRLLG